MKQRVLALGAAAAVVAAFGVVPARAATTPVVGTGTSAGELTLASVALGNLVHADVLGDTATATIDKAVHDPAEAVVGLNPLSVTSAATGLNFSLPPVEVRSTGQPQSVTTDSATLDNPVLGGELAPATLSAVVDAAGARSGLTSAITGLDLAGGLVSVQSIDGELGSSAASDKSTTLRGVTVDQVTLLDLGNLLAGLGLPLDQLPLDAVENLVGSLGLVPTVQGLLAGVGIQGVDLADVGDLHDLLGSLQGGVATANGEIDQLQSAVDTLVATPTTAVCQTVTSGLSLAGAAALLPGLPEVPGLPGVPDLPGNPEVPGLPALDCTTPATVIAALNTQIDSVQALATQLTDELVGLLDGVLATLDDTALLGLDGLQAGVLTRATDTVAGSTAKVTASIQGLHVGALALPGVDLTQPVSQITGVVTDTLGKVNGALAAIDPALGDLVTLDLLKQDPAPAVTQAGDTVTAAANVTAVNLGIHPPANLLDIINGLDPLASVGTIVTGLGGTVPQLGQAMTGLNSALGGVGVTKTAAIGDALSTLSLTDGASVVLGRVTQSSAFTPAAATTPSSPGTVSTPGSPATPSTPGTLPRTGEEATFPLLAGLSLGLAALGIRRWLRLRTTT